MRKEGVVLKHRVDVALVGRHAFGGLAEDLDVTFCRLLETGNEAQAGGLARSGRAEHSEEFTLRNVEGDAVYSPHRAEMAADIYESNGWRHGAAPSRGRPGLGDPGRRFLVGRVTCRGWRCSPLPTASRVRRCPPVRIWPLAYARTRSSQNCRTRWWRSPYRSRAHCPCRPPAP